MKQEEAMLKAKMDVLSVRKEAAVADADYLGMKEELDIWDEDSVCDDNNNSDILTQFISSQLMENEKNTDTNRKCFSCVQCSGSRMIPVSFPRNVRNQ